jgi:hypothetical protein
MILPISSVFKKITQNSSELFVLRNKKILAKKLLDLIENEFIYTYPDFSLNLLEEMTGVDQGRINKVLMQMYHKSFDHLQRYLRIKLFEEMISNMEEVKSLNHYVLLLGYPDGETMVMDLIMEKGLGLKSFVIMFEIIL